MATEATAIKATALPHSWTRALPAYLAHVYGEITPPDRRAAVAPELLYHPDVLSSSPRLEALPLPPNTSCYDLSALGDRNCQPRGDAIARTLEFTSSVSPRGLPTSVPALLFYNPEMLGPSASFGRIITDHTWIEVVRFASDCFASSNVYMGDGLMPAKTVPSAKLTSGARSRRGVHNNEPAPAANFPRILNGCWFFLGSGSGVFVNVGRNLHVATRAEITDRVVAWMGGRLDAFTRSDSLWCSYVVAHGYDSLAINVEHDWLNPRLKYISPHSGTDRNTTELVICNGGCARHHVRSACPPLELRTGLHATRPCTCEPTHAIINCGGGRLKPAVCRLSERLAESYEFAIRTKYNASQAQALPARHGWQRARR